MADRPILFSAPMIRALLDGRKTQTRRVLKHQPPPECSIHYMLGNESWIPEGKRSPLRHTWEAWGGPLHEQRKPGAMCGHFDVKMPFIPGDRLWVRETYAYWPLVGEHDRIDGCTYRATDEDEWENRMFDWIPSIHMPRWASRLTLIVTDVRVERLRNISAQDAIAEGVVWQEPTEADFEWAKDHEEEYGHPVEMEGVWTVPGAKGAYKGDVWGCTPEQSYRFLWNAINGAGAWDKNPWVVAVSFDVIRNNIDMIGG